MITRWVKLVGLTLLVPLTLAGCSTMTKEACVNTDWYHLGYKDGLQGTKSEMASERRLTCSEYGIESDIVAYQRGFNKGKNEYCRPENAYALGLQGETYTGICNKAQEEAFTPAYLRGLNAFHKTELERLRRENWRLEDKVRELKQEVRRLKQHNLELRMAP